MDLIKKFFILLAVFCVIGSAAAISAADVSDVNDGWAGSQYQDYGGWAGSQYNATAENATYHASNGTAPVAGNSTHNATNATNTTSPHTLLATGNPILLLLGIGAVAGGFAVLRRKN